MKNFANFMDNPIKYEEKVFNPDNVRYDSLSPGIYSDDQYKKDVEQSYENKNKFLGLLNKGSSEQKTSNAVNVEVDKPLSEPRIRGLRNSYRLVREYLQGLRK